MTATLDDVFSRISGPVLASLVPTDTPGDLEAIRLQVPSLTLAEVLAALRHLRLFYPLLELPDGRWLRPLVIFPPLEVSPWPLAASPSPVTNTPLATPPLRPETIAPPSRPPAPPASPPVVAEPRPATSAPSSRGSSSSPRPSPVRRATSSVPSNGSVADRSPAFAPLFTSLRLAAGLSQNALARLSHLDPALINRWEKGNRLPTAQSLGAVLPHLSPTPREVTLLYLAAGLAPPALAGILASF